MTVTDPRSVHRPLRRDRSVTVSPNALLGGIAAGGVAVVGLWWQDTEFVYGWGSALTNVGRITGLVCGWTVLVVLVLMARVPAIEIGVGADRLARWHAACGRYLVILSVAHTLAIIWGYALTARRGVVGEAATVVLDYPDVLLATIGVGLFVLVGIVSARAARRRLRYETWHLVHLLTYVAIGLAFLHALRNGADFVDPTVRAFWWTAYVGVAVTLVWFRIVTPLRASTRHRLRVVRVERAGRGVVSVYLRGRNLDALRAEPGQFFRWRFLAPGLWWAANPYSLSAVPTDDRLRITVKTAGGHSAALATLARGTRVLVEGPYGAFTGLRQTSDRVLLIGVGVGITPLRTLLETLPGRLTLLYRARAARDLVLRDEIDGVAAARGARVHYLLGSRDEQPLSAARLRELVPQLADHDVYYCGPEELAGDLRRALREAGVPARNIHHESFAF